MLTEDDVVDAVRDYLEAHDYEVSSALRATQRGVDIVALKCVDPRFELHIEAKGAGSSRMGSARYGSEFNSGQVFDHIAKAVLKALMAASAPSASTERRAGIAIPRNRLHIRHVVPVEHSLRKAGIAVFWVNDDASVQVDADWDV